MRSDAYLFVAVFFAGMLAGGAVVPPLVGHQTDLALDRAKRAESELAALKASTGLPGAMAAYKEP